MAEIVVPEEVRREYRHLPDIMLPAIEGQIEQVRATYEKVHSAYWQMRNTWADTTLGFKILNLHTRIYLGITGRIVLARLTRSLVSLHQKEAVLRALKGSHTA